MLKKRSKFTLFFVMIGAGLFFGLILAEGFLQIQYRLSWTSPIPFGMMGDNFDETFYIGFKPNFKGVSKTDIEYRTNLLGFRDDPIETSGEHIIFLGDSTTFGLNIQHSETFPEKVEQKLKEQGYDFQSINTASPGQGTVSQLRILDAILNKSYLNPQCIVLGFFCNDFSNNMWYRAYLEERIQEKSSENKNDQIEPIVTQKRKFKLRTFLYLKTLKRRLRGEYGKSIPASEEVSNSREFYNNRGAINEWGEYKFRPGREVEWSWLSRQEMLQNRSYLTTIEALNSIIQLCEDRSIPFIMLYLPWELEKEMKQEGFPLNKVMLEEEISRAENAVFVDGVKIYSDYLDKEGLTQFSPGFYSSPGDLSHPGPLACTLISEALVSVIVKSLKVQFPLP